MDKKKIERISKALADETRLKIFEAIAGEKDMTCGDLVSMQGVTPATISHHLKILMDADLIRCEKKGQFVHSRTVPRTVAEYAEALAGIAKGSSGRRRAKRG